MRVFLQPPSDRSRVCLRWKFHDVDIDLLDDGHPTCAMTLQYLVELLERETSAGLHEKARWLRSTDHHAAC
jgi:hypothetical protein